MIAADTIHLAVRNLREALLRTSLTALGVAIGIASLVGMVSFGIALQDQVVGAFMRSGVFDSITVTSALPAAARRGGGRGMGPRLKRAIEPNPNVPRARLDDEALQKIAGLANVKEVYPDLRVPVEVKFDQFSEFSMARGVPLSARGEGVFQNITIGTFLRNETNDACMLSLDFARHVAEGEPKDLVGKDLTLGYVSAADLAQLNPLAMANGVNIQRTEKKFRIVGIVDRQAGGAGMIAGMLAPVMIPLAKARDMGTADLTSPQGILSQLTDKRSYTTATVKVRRAQDVEEVEKKIRDLGLTAISVADLLENQKRAFILLDLMLGLVGSIALTVASLGIVNTMVMSILERTREIGIMKAIGGSDGDVRRIFMVEAGLIGLMGGFLGLLLGWAVGRVINFGANFYLRSQGAAEANLFLIPWWLIAGGLLFALLVSLVAGHFPASRAAHIDPIRALRHD